MAELGQEGGVGGGWGSGGREWGGRGRGRRERGSEGRRRKVKAIYAKGQSQQAKEDE